MNHRRVLENMRTLIDHGWTQGCGARNAGNVRVEITAPDACRWCLVGAAHLATLAEPDATDNDHCGVCGVRRPDYPCEQCDGTLEHDQSTVDWFKCNRCGRSTER